MRAQELTVKRVRERMDMKKILVGTALSLFFLSAGLSACSSADKTEKPSSENQLQSDYMEVDGILTKTEKGSFSAHAGLMYFTDYETQTSIPVCGKPNCRHLSVYEDEKTTCSAVCSSPYMFPYKDKLYRIERGEDQKGKLIASEMDGSNPKTVGTFFSGDMLESVVILNGNMYYTYSELQKENIAEQGESQAQDGQIMDFNCSMNRLDLDTSEQTEIVTLKDVNHILMLGGTKEYQVCAVVKNDGVYFTYQEKYVGEKEIEGDLLVYDAYIEKDDLFGKTGEMKVIYTPRVSSAGNIVTEE